MPSGFAKILHLLLCYLSLRLIASSNSPRYSGTPMRLAVQRIHFDLDGLIGSGARTRA
jgi:hypothetical protein